MCVCVCVCEIERVKEREGQPLWCVGRALEDSLCGNFNFS